MSGRTVLVGLSQTMMLGLSALLASWAFAVGAMSAAQGGEDLSAYLPPGDGKALVVTNCGGCHGLRSVVPLRKTKQAWEAIVLDMSARGAPIMPDDVDPMVSYLGTAFGVDAPPFIDVNAASREELTKIPGVTAAAADRLIKERAKTPLTSHQQAQAALGLNAKAFEKVKYYLYVKGSGHTSH
jgi:Helix-hairpin-helix motif